VATTRARDAVSFARVSALAIATAASSANWPRRVSTAVRVVGPVLLDTSAALIRPSTVIGTAVVEVMPAARATSANGVFS
jgi:hypothetical protein